MSGQKITLPPEMVEKYIYLYGNHPTKSANGQINCGCPICREGTSWGKKRRMYYYPDAHFIYCFNCNQSWSEINWIKQASGKSFKELMIEAGKYSFIAMANSVKYFSNESSDDQSDDKDYELPYETIKLNSNLQKLYYQNTPIIQTALSFINRRRLDRALNIPDYGISLKDRIHKNRLIIPFVGLDGSVPFYQTRKLIDSDFLPKYLSKKDSEKTVFGIDKVDLDFPYLFITEGPIDSCFIKNGVSLAGLKYTDYQIDQLSNFFTHDKIWVLDNDFKTNQTVFAQYEKLIENGEKIFIWPETMNKFKDVNEYCIGMSADEFPYDIILENSYSGLRATQILKGLK